MSTATLLVGGTLLKVVIPNLEMHVTLAAGASRSEEDDDEFATRVEREIALLGQSHLARQERTAYTLANSA